MSPPRLGVWPPLPPGAWLRRPADPPPYPLAEPGWSLWERARHALWHGLPAIGLAAGDEVLAPAFHHGSEIEVLVRLGLRPRFYGSADPLRPDEAELESLIGPRTRALYLVHYIGHPQDAARWRRFCDARGLLLVEDAAQSWLAHDRGVPVGSHGDLAVFCLYKSVALPLGAALRVGDAAPAPGGSPVSGAAGAAARHAAWAMSRSGALARLAPNGSAPYDPARDVALGDPDAAPSRAIAALIPHLADPAVAARRLANHRLLADRLGDIVHPGLSDPPDGASPMVLALDAADKPALLARLDEAGIAGLNLWSVPHPALPAGDFPAAAALRARLVGLPVHQELRTADLGRIARAAAPRPRPTAGRRLEPLDDLESIAGEWNALAEAAGNPFMTADWAAVWWRHFGAGRPLLAHAARAGDGRLVAVIALYLWRARPLRVARLVGHGLGGELGPACAPADRAAAARALREAMARAGADVLVAEALPAGDGWPALAGGTVGLRSASPVVRLNGGSWDDFLAERSSNLRGQVRRRERRLAREHDLAFRLADDPERLPADLDLLFRLHRERWGEESPVFAGAREDFHRELAARLMERGWLRLWFLELDGEPVAAWHGFRLGGVESYYQAGRARRLDDAAVGFVLLAHTIRSAVEDGMTEYRLGPGDGSYKYRFASDDPGLDWMLVGRGAAGRAAVAAGSAARRVGPLRGAFTSRLGG